LTIIDSGIIYFNQNASYFGHIPGTSTLGSTVGFNENTTLPFEPGKTYRLRIINTSAFAAFIFWIDGHEMTIIEVDGVSPKYMSTPGLLLLELIFYSVD
jgi:iron transport multicopper oxidase